MRNDFETKSVKHEIEHDAVGRSEIALAAAKSTRGKQGVVIANAYYVDERKLVPIFHFRGRLP